MKRTFAREFKRQVASQALAGEKGVAQLCQEHGLCQTLVRRWRDQYQSGATTGFPGQIRSSFCQSNMCILARPRR